MDPFSKNPSAAPGVNLPHAPGDFFDPKPHESPAVLIQKLLMWPRSNTDGGAAIPVSNTLTIQNNSSVTVYPALRDGNNSATTNNPRSVYDPTTPSMSNTADTSDFKTPMARTILVFPGQSITVRIPLVFWDGAAHGSGHGRLLPSPRRGVPGLCTTIPTPKRVIVAVKPRPAALPPSAPNHEWVVM